EKIIKIIKKEKVNKIVIGVSEGQIGEESKKFGEKLGKKVNLPVHFQDETLTTQDAQALSIIAGIKRKKRRALEDAYSAALILRNYLDSK
ncbi:Holliday junction resolvase RuvX, partial [Candidatus Woesebacteria bacterium]